MCGFPLMLSAASFVHSLFLFLLLYLFIHLFIVFFRSVFLFVFRSFFVSLFGKAGLAASRMARLASEAGPAHSWRTQQAIGPCRRTCGAGGRSGPCGHSYSYAQLVYKLAYQKAHNPKKFWESTLKNVNSAYRKWVHFREAKKAGLKLSLGKATNVDEINNLIKKFSLSGRLVNQIDYQIDTELVSNDIIGNTCCAVFDSNATIVSNNGEDIVLYTWYDNEFGYTKQVIRLAKQIAKVRRHTYY